MTTKGSSIPLSDGFPSELSVDSRMGSFVRGFKSEDDEVTIRGWVPYAFYASLALMVFGFLSIAGKKDTPVSIIIMVSLTLIASIVMLFVYIDYRDKVKKKNSFRENVYVFTNGFIWEYVSLRGERVKTEEYCFDDIKASVFTKENDSSRGLDDVGKEPSHTYHFKLLDFTDEEVFKRDKIYESDHWMLNTLNAIEESVTNVFRVRAERQLANDGYIDFGNIRIGRNMFTVDGKDWLNGIGKYVAYDDKIVLFPADPQNSPFYKKVINPTGAFAVKINQANRKLIIEFFNNFFRGRMGSEYYSGELWN